MKNIGVILAAGKSSRFKGREKKIFLNYKNKTFVDHAIDKFIKLGFETNIVINKVDKHKFKRKNCKFLYQKKALGTGHAIKIFLKKNPKFKKCLIINADTPLIHIKDIKRVLNATNSSNLSILGFLERRNTSNGVFIKTKSNKFIIKEYDLLNSLEKKNNLCNSGVIAFDMKISKEFFNIKKNLKKKEYLITDILDIVLYKKYKVKIIKAKYPNLCQGVNTNQDFKKLIKIL